MFNSPPNDPYELFTDWYKEAEISDPENYNALNITTVNTNSEPASRIVLLKGHSRDGFVFFTNYNSRKGKDLGANSAIAAGFWWPLFNRQVRIEGHVQKVTSRESDDYFLSRPRLSRIASVTSQQSEPVESIELLEKRFQQNIEKYQDKEPQRPDHWGGYCIVPLKIEFWQGMPHRLHHRLVYKRGTVQSEWTYHFLQP